MRVGALDDSGVERASPAINMWRAGPPSLRSNSDDGIRAAAALQTDGTGARPGLPPIRQSSDGAATLTAYGAGRRGSPQPFAGVGFGERRLDPGTVPGLGLAVGHGMAGGDDAAHAVLTDELYRAGTGVQPSAGRPIIGLRAHQAPAPLQVDAAVWTHQDDLWRDDPYGHESADHALGTGSTSGSGSGQEGYSARFGAGMLLDASVQLSPQPCPSLRRMGYCRDGVACPYTHSWYTAQPFAPGYAAHSPAAYPILAPQPLASFPLASPSPTSSLLSMESPARMQSVYGPQSPSPPPALVSQDSVGGFAFGAPGSAAFSTARPAQQPSPPQQQHSLARAAFANAAAAQHGSGVGGGGGDGAPHDVRVYDPRLVRAALNPSNTFIGAGGNIGYNASSSSFDFGESRLDQYGGETEHAGLSTAQNSDGAAAGLPFF